MKDAAPQVTDKQLYFESAPDVTINGVLVDLKLGKWNSGPLVKKWWFWAVLIGLFIIVLNIFLFPPPTASQTKFAQIREGMTKAEVAQIMGGKENDKGTLKRRFDTESDLTVDYMQWSMEDGGRLSVYFHKDGTVQHVSYWSPQGRSVSETIRAWWKWLGF